MPMILSLVLFIITLPAFATTTFSTQIYDIDIGKPQEETLIFLTTGQVVTFPHRKNMLSFLKEAIKNKTWFSITLNEEREIIDLKRIDPPSPKTSHSLDKSFWQETPFVPSILKDMDQARSFFYEARTDAIKQSECYDRAHIWSYEWRINKNLYSSKAWLFFTRKYIRKYKFQWWFHVAPMIHVIVDGEVKQRMMDIKHALGPLTQKQWTNIFMRNGADCPVVEKYSEQANFPESGSCFVMKTSMYYYQPLDLEKEELTGEKKVKWVESEVRHAYKEAFDIDL